MRLPGCRWDHNAWYHPLLLRRLPPHATSVLDVGSGTGELAASLAGRVDRVDAIDRSPAMAAAARARVPANVRVLEADVMTLDLPSDHYDAVVSMSALHHLPLEPALERMAGWLRPGGVLAAVALPRRDLPRELPTEATAAVLQRAIGLALVVPRWTGRRWLAKGPEHDAMPVRDPELTVRQVRERAAGVLPGVRVRRLVFWRYLLEWRKPPP